MLFHYLSFLSLSLINRMIHLWDYHNLFITQDLKFITHAVLCQSFLIILGFVHNLADTNIFLSVERRCGPKLESVEAQKAIKLYLGLNCLLFLSSSSSTSINWNSRISMQNFYNFSFVAETKS